MKSSSWPRSFLSFVALAGVLTLLSGCDVKELAKPRSAGPSDEDKEAREKQKKIDRVSSLNNMKRIGLGMHNYASVNRRFPPAYVADKNGKPLLSWRVLILPYVDQDNLFREFHLDESWDSEHNKTLLAKMPNVYKALGSTVVDQWKTNYLTVRGVDTIFSGKTPCTFGSIRDGTSNTVMTVEVSDARAVEWTRPDDIEFNPQNPVDGLVGLRENGFLIGVADGSTRFVQLPKSPETLNAWFNKSDRKAVPISD